jgi:predicted dehydrogenase
VDTIRFGIVGMGARARGGWIRTLPLTRRATVVAVCDTIEPLRLEGARLAGIDAENAYEHVDEMLARSDIDAVVVSVQPINNPGLVVKALEAGKHVLCDVPLSLDLDACWRVVRTVERTGLTFALAEQCSYAPFVSAWRKLLDEGLLGAISYGEAQYINGKGLDRYWQDAKTGERLSWEEARHNPNARKTHFWDLYHSILYTTHSLGPLMRVLDERVVKVTCLATPRPSRFLHEIIDQDVPLPDLEVALMQTASGAILRLMVGFVCPYPGPDPHHWYHLLGTKGEVETGRRRDEKQPLVGTGSLQWLADHYTNGRTEMDWGFSMYDTVALRAAASGHGGLDYFPAHDFVESILQDRRPGIDVYRAAELAAPAIIAGLSEEQGGASLPVPDFRPGPDRAPGERPREAVHRRESGE